MSLSAMLFGRDSAIHRITNILGLGIPGWLDKKFGAPDMQTEGPRLSDMSTQTSTYGATIPRVYGAMAVVGNIIWLENNQLKEVVRRQKVKSGGKGGSSSKTTQTTYSYYATLAIGLCEGEITGVRRIWAGPNLIYDAASDDVGTIVANNKAMGNITIYRGGIDQQPDPRIQADRGVNNTPAYRGLAYVVVKDFSLGDYGNSIPAFKFEIVNSAEVVGLRRISSYTQPGRLSELSETSSALSLGGGVLSMWLDPSDPRPPYGKPENYHRRAFRVVDGSFISQTHDSADFSRPSLAAWNYALGETLGWGYSYHQSSAGSGLVQGTKLVQGTNLTAKPEDADRLIPCLTPDGLWLFRRKSTGEWYYEHMTDPDTVVRSGAIVGSGGVAFSANLGFGPHSHHPSAGSSLCVEAGGNYLWLITPSVSDPRISVYARAGDDFLFQESVSAQFGANSINLVATDGICAVVYRESIDVFARGLSVQPGDVPLAEIVAAECSASGLLLPEDYNTSALTDAVTGYRVSSVGSIRAAISQLQRAFPFDAYQYGYQIRFRSRGQLSVATIDIAELGVDEQLPQSREMDSQLPAKMVGRYLDQLRDYDVNEQYAERINTDAVNTVEIELAIVLSASQAAQVVERLLYLAWFERADFGPFHLPPTYGHLEPTDVITIAAGYANYEIRLTEISYNADGTLTCSGKPNSAGVYVSTAASNETPLAGVISLSGGSMFVPLDIPVIDELTQDSPGFVGAMTGYLQGWPGAIAMQSNDGGQTWAGIQAFDGVATIGHAIGALAASPCTLLDQSALGLTLISGELESLSEAQMLAGANWAAYGVDGRWEILRYRDADLQADGTYLLSGFKRGDRGTEWATGLHRDGDLFIPLDDGDLALIGMSIEAIGTESTWRGVTSGDATDDAEDVPFTYRGVNLECLSPVYPVATRNGAGDLSLSWTRRSRLGSHWWATGTPAPLGEASEAYDIEILSGSTVVRSLSSSTPSMTYTAAQQTEDFGAAQASISVRIYQLSATVGRGYPAEVTV